MEGASLARASLSDPEVCVSDPARRRRRPPAVFHLHRPGDQSPGTRLQDGAHHGLHPAALHGLALLHAAPGVQERRPLQQQPPGLPHARGPAGEVHAG